MIDIGDDVQITLHVVDEAGDPIDPATVTIQVTAPDGNVSTPAVTNPQVGQYRATVLADAAGRWRWTWTATGPAAVEHGFFDVLQDPPPPARPDPLATPDQLPPHLRNDPRAVERIAQASAEVRSVCGWHIAPSITETLVLDGSGTWAQELPSLHVTALDEVLLDGVAAEDVDWSERGQLRRRQGRFPDRFRSVKVTLTHGLSETPPEVVAVVLAAAERSMTGTPGTQSIRVGGLSQTFATGTEGGTVGTVDLTRRERSALGPYRLPAQQGDG